MIEESAEPLVSVRPTEFADDFPGQLLVETIKQRREVSRGFSLPGGSLSDGSRIFTPGSSARGVLEDARERPVSRHCSSAAASSLVARHLRVFDLKVDVLAVEHHPREVLKDVERLDPRVVGVDGVERGVSRVARLLNQSCR